jgi:hypothetical protein
MELDELHIDESATSLEGERMAIAGALPRV